MNNNSEANEWYRFAKMYANAASFLMEKRGPPYEAVCYLSGLSAECAMKGFLLERNPGIPLPDTHNLRELCQACAWFEDEFSSLLDDCQALGQFATPSGFPSLSGPPRRTWSRHWTPSRAFWNWANLRNIPRGLP